MGTAQQSHPLKSFFLIEHGVHQQDASEKLIAPEPILSPSPIASLSQDAEECIFLRGIWLAAARRGDAGRFMIVENGCLSLCAFGMLGG